MTWKPCECHDCKKCGDGDPHHAMLDLHDVSSGDRFNTRVPYSHRHHAAGWGDRQHVRWTGDDGQERRGVRGAGGGHGITATGEDGEEHQLTYGGFTTHNSDGSDGDTEVDQGFLDHNAAVLVHQMRKGKALKTGQRWITVHPHGKDEKGVPILIQEESDGTHRVIGGAGGKLTHLKLTGVKSPEEYKEKAKEKGKERRAKERDRKEQMSAEATEQEAESKEDLKAKKLLAERDVVHAIRDRMGGVDKDLDEDRLIGMSKGSRNLVLTRHHKKQLRQAKRRYEDSLESIVDHEAREATSSKAVSSAMREDPVAEAEARDVAGEELALLQAEATERKAERRQAKMRTPSKAADVGSRAAEAIDDAINEHSEKHAGDLEALGGRDDLDEDAKGKLRNQNEKASMEVDRRALQALDSAKRLDDAAKSGDLDDKVVAAAIDKLDLGDAEPEAVADALDRESARQFRRYEIQSARANRFRELESDKETAGKAWNALAYSDMLGGIASAAGTAKRMGLTESEESEPKAAELAEFRETVRDYQKLRAVEKEFRQVNKAIEGGDYKAAREAFTVKYEPTDEKVELTVKEEVQRDLTERLVALGSRKRSEFLDAVANAQYAGFADVALGISGQRYIDRSVVDALGPANAAKVLRHALEADGHDRSNMLQAVEEHHVARLEDITSDALAKAEKWAPGLDAAVEDVDDIESAIMQVDVHEDDLAEAQRAVGAAIGRMEATASIAETMRKPASDIHLSSENLQADLQWLHAIGLSPSDYHISYDSEDRGITIPQSSYDKMVNRMPKEEFEHRKVLNDIKAGKHDEEGWLPAGIVSRAATSFTNPVPEAPKFFQSYQTGTGAAGVEGHVGSRLAEGEHPRTILSDLLAPAILDNVPDKSKYIDEVKRLIPLVDSEGNARKYEDHAEHFKGLAEKHMIEKYGEVAGAFHAQSIDVDTPEVQESAFRALAANPRAAVAFKPPGELSPQDRRALRSHFYERMGIDPKSRIDETRFQKGLDELGGEPSKTAGTMSLFGGGGPSPEWREWQRDRDALLQKYPRAGLDMAIKALGDKPGSGPGLQEYQDKVGVLKQAAADAPTAWAKYVQEHGSLELALGGLQDELKSQFVRDFRDNHGKATGKGLRVGVQEVRNHERHVRATASPEERDEMLAETRRLQSSLRERIGGRFAGEGKGSVKEKVTKWMEQETIAKQNQASLFTAKQMHIDRTKEPEAGTGERYSLGEQAEAQLASLVSNVSGQIDPNGPRTKVFPGLNMDGDRVHQQRVIKMLDSNGGRMGGWLGTGSGKSLISIGAFTNAHAQGKASHGLFLVPSSVEQQFGGEMLKFTEPGKYKWATGSDAGGHEGRVAMLKDMSTHMRVMTHQSFRDTSMQIMADHHGKSREQMRQDLSGVSAGDRAKLMKDAFAANDIPQHMVYWDEAHGATTREGVDASGLNLIATAVTHPTNASQMLLGTATPHKNDESEVHSMASLIDPNKFGDRNAFMRNFGKDMGQNPDAIRREMSHMTYSARIDPSGVERLDSDNPSIVNGKKQAGSGSIKLEGEHKARVDRVGEMYKRASKAHRNGQVDVAAIRELAPRQFEGKPESRHRAIAAKQAKNLGLLKEAAQRRAINQAPPEINQKLQRMADVVEWDLKSGTYKQKDGKMGVGKPSVIFSDRLSEVKMITEELKRRGIRAVSFHGGLNSKDRETLRRGFTGEGGEDPSHDVVVATSAAEAGINMQRAKSVHHYDVPQTSKSHTQRSGRAYRQGQTGDVDVHNWHTDAEHEQNALRRLNRKEGLAEVFETPIGNMDETGIAGAYQRALSQKHQDADIPGVAA